MTDLITSVRDMQAVCADARQRGLTIGFVPTMGALHAGHGALMDQARAESQVLAVSIFVNPLQFDRRGDFDRYSRNLPLDREFCSRHRVDLLFAPSAKDMYPLPPRTFVEVTGISERLCGEFRPGHFRGVATVVAKLLNIVQPHTAYFGQKDAQQLSVITRMVDDLNMPVKIIGVPTVRERDGLALSSRNSRLTREERAVAPRLFQALQTALQTIQSGCCSAAHVRQTGLDVLSRDPRFRVEYFEVVTQADMQPVQEIDGPVVIAAAVWLGATRLIDNVAVECTPPIYPGSH